MKKSPYLQVSCCGSTFSKATLAESLSILRHPPLKQNQTKIFPCIITALIPQATQNM